MKRYVSVWLNFLERLGDFTCPRPVHLPAMHAAAFCQFLRLTNSTHLAAFLRRSHHQYAKAAATAARVNHSRTP
jgi:hypothetical protein